MIVVSTVWNMMWSSCVICICIYDFERGVSQPGTKVSAYKWETRKRDDIYIYSVGRDELCHRGAARQMRVLIAMIFSTSRYKTSLCVIVGMCEICGELSMCPEIPLKCVFPFRLYFKFNST